MICILDFGSQYSQLIARKVRSLGVYAEIVPYNISPEKLRGRKPGGIILSGGPATVKAKGSPRISPEILDLDIPVLGICYGMQLITDIMGGQVERSDTREYGQSYISVLEEIDLFSDIPSGFRVWMSHGDSVRKPPRGFKAIATSQDCPVTAMKHDRRPLFGLQFHPEVHHTRHGKKILQNFAVKVCGEKKNWKMGDFARRTIEEIRHHKPECKIICGVSGGVDSTVLAVLLHRAVGDRLKCIFIDNGLLRKGEAETVLGRFEKLGVPVQFIDASDRFLKALEGVMDPEEKRRIIGREFVDVFMPSIGQDDLLAQGTLYPDVIESVSVKGPSATIKTHHNRVQEILDLGKQNRLVEPLKELFKDEVRKVGAALDIPKGILLRQPFPGPGLAVRIIGSVSPERLKIIREADVILLDEIKDAGLYQKIWQAFCVLMPIQSVGVMGDERTYENVVAIRAVKSVDGMTADWVRIPQKILARISNRIINEVKGINRVVYDISSKPPSTIEWE